MKRKAEEDLPSIEEIVQDPEKFLKREKRGWPPKWEGNLLAWMVAELEEKNHLNQITRIKMLEVRNFNGEVKEEEQYYKFDPSHFNRETKVKYSRIECFSKMALDRFEMSNGGFYQYEQSDGEYTEDRLVYCPPMKPDFEIVLKENFNELF